jgi:uncharacterized membrane protein YkvA (DUF1232 family)
MKTILERIPYIKNFDLSKMPTLEQVSMSARQVASKVPFTDDMVALYFCATDSTVPSKVKIAIAAALAYLVLPVDAIPDVLPVLGFSDDAAVLTAVYSLVSGYINENHREKARRFLAPQDKEDAPVRNME